MRIIELLRKCFGILSAISLVCFCMSVFAEDVPLAWDASTSANISGYKVYLGTSSRSYGTPTVIGNQTAYTVTGLTAGTYYFAVTAFDVDGNESDFSNEVTKTIASSSDTTPPIISGVSSSNITSTGVTISWTTNESSGSVVDFGTTANYGDSVIDSSMTTSHSRTLTGLAANTLYHFRVKSTDAAGNLAASAHPWLLLGSVPPVPDPLR